MSSRWPGLHDLPQDDPPPYRPARRSTPTFQSNRSSDEAEEDIDAIEPVPQVFTSNTKHAAKKKLKSEKPTALKQIKEKIEPFQKSEILQQPAPMEHPELVPQANPDVESASKERSGPKYFICSCCSNNVFSCCNNNRGPWCLPALIVIILFIIVAIVLGVLIPHALKDHHAVFPANATVVTTVTSVIHATTIQTVDAASSSPTVSPTPPPTASKSAEQYLGGFDAVSVETGQLYYMFYTDQQGGLQSIWQDDYGTWAAMDRPTIATNVRAGSPVSAGVISGNVYIFYVDTNDTVQGLFGSPDGKSASWSPHTIGSLNLKASNTSFLRTCVLADTRKYKYSTTAAFYLYFQDPQGTVQKYGYTGSPATVPQNTTDLPDFGTASTVECQFAAGVETLWTINGNSQIRSWWRSNVTNWQWTPGHNVTVTPFNSSSLLSISDSSTNRSHILFQDSTLRIQQFDFNGFGAEQTFSSSTILSPSTPGTRLATWANSGYCGSLVSIYYQQGNTSNAYYSSFEDKPTDDDFWDTDTDESYMTTFEVRDQQVPIMRTWGRNVGGSDAARKAKHVAAVVGFVLLGIVCLLVLCCCCAGG